MTIKTYTYHLHELTDYINWLYFFHSWGFPPQFASIARQHACPACQQDWVNSFPIAEREKARTCLKLYQEAIEQLQQLDKDYVVRGICGLFQVTTQNDDIIFNLSGKEIHFPCLRQQLQQEKDGVYLCLTDYINPCGDRIGVFATTVDAEMEKLFPRIRNYNVSVREVNGRIVFLRKLVEGGSAHSFGIHVARLAGMPRVVVERADEILKDLERNNSDNGVSRSDFTHQEESNGMQLNFFQLDDPVLVQIRDEIKGLDINNLTPMEALNKLNEIQKIVSGQA